VRAVEQARPAVVNIQGHKIVPADNDQFLSNDGTREVNGMGTGVVLDERGYIITNHHVVDGVRQIEVTTADGQAYTARLVAHDPQTDLAIIHIPLTKALPTVTIGTSADLMAGEPVIAVGNAYGYEHTVTRGIISALHRNVQVSEAQRYDDLIQTDASINPGNSGGPLLNIDGEMIGINVAVRVGAQGIGFAIPVDKVIEVATQLLSAERTAGVQHGLVGTAEQGGRFVVQTVAANSPAAEGGIQPGDVIQQVGSVRVQRQLDVERALLGRGPGETVPIQIQRQNATLAVELALSAAPRSREASDDRVWQTLGMKLVPLSAEQFRRVTSRYRGGLKVTAVRTDGPAARQGIRTGDVLVGMHIWETVSLSNVQYILNRPEFNASDSIKFYILRDNETLYGHLPVSWSR